MGPRKTDDEKAIVAAFLRTGHPWLAFGTVTLKSGPKTALVAVLTTFGVGQTSALMPELMQLLFRMF